VSHVVVAGFASAIRTVVIPALARLRDLATVEIIEAEDAEALRDLGLGAVDVVLTQEYDGSTVERNRRFTYTPLVRDPLRLVLPPAMPAATTLDQLADAPWLLNGRSSRCAQATTRLLDAAGLRPDIVGTVADNATLLALVAAGQGVTVVPGRVIDRAAPEVTIATQDLGITRVILGVSRTATTAAVSAVLALLASVDEAAQPTVASTRPGKAGRRRAGAGRARGAEHA
jgi:DNA-binding transcriptional LysR family regulator